jgi:glutamate-1-semialdehyde 2,1-aminomutase
MTEDLAALIQSGDVNQYGTLNGNPLVMAAAHATLTEVLTRDAFKHLEAINDKLLGGSRELLERYGLPGYPVGMGAKGCVAFASGPIREYRDYLTKINGELDTLAWLYHMNRGVFMTPGVEEEWTLSVAHTDDDVGRYLEASGEFARDVTGS